MYRGGKGATAEVVALFLGNGCFLFSVSFGPARPVLWHCALHSSALRLFRAIAVPPCFAYKLAIVLPLLWLSPLQRCNIGAQIRVFLHSTTRISDGVQLRAHWTLSPASSKQQVSKRPLSPSGRVRHSSHSQCPSQCPSQSQSQFDSVLRRLVPPCAVPHQNCMHVMPMLRHIRACPSA